MPDVLDHTTDPSEPMVCRIRLRGHFDSKWTDWFGNFSIISEENGDTTLFGPVEDQAVLHGLFKKVRDMGIPLISLHIAVPDAKDCEKTRLVIQSEVEP